MTNKQTLQDFLQQAAAELEAADVYCGHGTDNTYDEAVWLCLHALGDDVQNPSSKPDRILTESQIKAATGLIQRRIQERKPAAYLTHQAWFAGLEFYVDERVLVPRSPIAEMIAEEFSPWYQGPQPQRILDLCTGSGCIAIACALQYPQAQVDASDLSADALAVAEINRSRHQLEHRLSLYQGDLFTPLPGHRYDLIVSNPPYVGAAEMAAMPQEFIQEPEMGFAGGHSGMDLVAQILLKAKHYLSPEGLLVVEVGDHEVADQAFADTEFTWPEFSNGGHGVFVLQAEQLALY